MRHFDKRLHVIYCQILAKYPGEVPLGATAKEEAIIDLHSVLIEERCGLL